MTTMDALSKLLSNAKLSGVYRPAQGSDEIARAAKAAKLSIVKLDLGTVQGKGEFLARLAKALKCPSYFGMNWDALNDCLTDLSWLDDNGWVVILVNGQDFTVKNQKDFNTAIDVFQAAAEYWRSHAKPFWIFVYGDNDWNPGLPQLPAPPT
jgi:RNAse (barnase) inhibitor barstar